MPFNLSNLYNSVARFGVTDFLRNLNRNALIVYESTPSGFRSTSGVNRAAGDRAFIVGFIPPDVAVNFVPVRTTGGKLLSSKQVFSSSARTGNASLPKVKNLDSKTSPAFRAKLVRIAQDLGIPPAELASIIGFETGYTFDPSIQNSIGATGLIQFLGKTARDLGTTTDALKQMSAVEQLDYVQKFLGKLAKWKYPGDTYCMVFWPEAIGKPPDYVIAIKDDPTIIPKTKLTNAEVYAKNMTKDGGLDFNNDGVITADDVRQKALDIAKKSQLLGEIPVNLADENNPGATQLGLAVTDVATPATIVNAEGKPVVQEVGIMSGNMRPMFEGSGDPYKDLGRYIEVDDIRLKNAKKVRDDINSQIRIVAATPSMLMYVNPKSFNRHFEQTVDVTGGWRGQIVSMWLEQPLKISGSGASSVQYAFQNDGGGGLTNVNRVFSLSYENLMSLSTFYRNNGWLYTGETYDLSNVGVPTLACSIFIYYDGHIYIGSFDSFKIEETVDSPFTMNYSFEFTARYDFLLLDSLGEATLAGARR